MSVTRVAVVGLYNSGSTAVAGMLHRLGVDLCAPFWEVSDDDSPVNYYESQDLARRLRRWWREPLLVERIGANERVLALRDWIASRGQHARVVGAKHPLLSMCCDELRSAWGAQTRFVWSWRPLQESIAGLTRRQWYPGHEETMQTRLWGRLNAFDGSADTLLKLDWRDVQRDPRATAETLSSWLKLDANTDLIARAAGFVKAGNG